MYIDKVNISETYEIFNGERVLRWKKIDASVSLKEGEDSMKGADFLQDFINEWNKREYKPKEETMGGYQISTSKENPNEQPKTQEQRIIEQIQQCSDTTVLKSFELIAKNNPKIFAAYQIKLTELTK